MNYSEIIAAALAYSDRTDADLVSSLDTFLRIVESKLNRLLRTSNMSVRATITTVADQEYYGLPTGFAGMRDIEVIAAGSTKGSTAIYLSPEQMNACSNSDGNIYYTVIADQLQIFPTSEGFTLEVVYYKRLTELSETNTNNWLSDGYPDAYIFGLLVEISSYVKNPEAAGLWSSRLMAIVGEMVEEDGSDRWSGTPLTVKVG